VNSPSGTSTISNGIGVGAGVKVSVGGIEVGAKVNVDGSVADSCICVFIGSFVAGTSAVQAARKKLSVIKRGIIILMYFIFTSPKLLKSIYRLIKKTFFTVLFLRYVFFHHFSPFILSIFFSWPIDLKVIFPRENKTGIQDIFE
jgi:hypothetical protein